MKVLATALIQCHFDYASTSWFGGLSKLMKGKLQIAQNNLIRVVLTVSPRTHIGRSCFQELNWLPVDARVSQIRLDLVYKITFLVLGMHTITAPDQVLLICAYTDSGVMPRKVFFKLIYLSFI